MSEAMNDAVTDYVEKIKEEWQVEISKKLRHIVHQVVPNVQERIQYGKPHFVKGTKYVAVLGTAKDWVNFTIFNATDIEGPEGFFEPGPSERKSVKIRKDQAIDYDLLGNLLHQAASSI